MYAYYIFKKAVFLEVLVALPTKMRKPFWGGIQAGSTMRFGVSFPHAPPSGSRMMFSGPKQVAEHMGS